MSNFLVKVRRLIVGEHPNADLLELGQVDDYRVVIAKGVFHTGDLAVYIPEQSIVPSEIITALGLDGKLAGAENNRVKAIKLRGELSQGLIYRPEPWPETWVEGHDVADELGIVKWEPPIPISMAGDVERAPADGIFRTYTEIENIKGFPGVLIDGEEVIMTEKLHGTCLVCGLINGQRAISSKGIAHNYLMLRESATNVYWRAAAQFGLFEKLEAFLRDDGREQVIIFGEILGVQDLKYGLSSGQISFRAFDLFTQEGFADIDAFEAFGERYEVPRVPILYRGPFSKEVMLTHTSGTSTLAAHLREGVVIRPVHERDDRDTGRVIFKSVSDAYLLRKNGTEMN